MPRKPKTATTVTPTEEIQEEITTATENALALSTELVKKRKSKKSQREDANGLYDEFPDLARLMGVSIEQLKDEFFLFQIRKLMGKIGKVIVRNNLPEKQIEKILVNSSLLKLGEVLIAPAYLPECAKLVEKNGLQTLPVYSLIDFPFGESLLKGKMADIRDSVNEGVDGVTVVIASLLIMPDRIKEYKKQIRKIGKSYLGHAGIALNATDLSDDQLKLAFKIAERSKISFITLLFGQTALPELVEKLSYINTVRGDKKIKVLANVDTVEGAMELFNLGVNTVLTPYADEIGSELLRRFKIQGVKLR